MRELTDLTSQVRNFVVMIVARSTRSLAASARRLRLPRRLLSTEAAESAAPAPSSKIVVCQDGEVASVQLSNAPVNSLTLEVCEELVAALRSLEAEPSVRGVLLGSALPSVFSAGLDLTSLHGSTEDELARYWTAVQEMWLTLYMTPLATVASVGGHSPAGGCMLALSCDERVMVEGKPRIGLNETQLGIVAPPWFGTLLRDTVGARPAERMLQLGSLLSPEEALAAGMVDEVVPLHQLHGAASARLERLLAVPDAARAATKQMLRHAAADQLSQEEGRRSEDLDAFVQHCSSPEVQASLGAYLASLKKKKEK